MALVISPENRMPPSAISGTPVLLETDRQFMIAVICGMPTPATMRVVPEDKPDEFTEVRYEGLEFDVGLSPDYFSLRQLRARN